MSDADYAIRRACDGRYYISADHAYWLKAVKAMANAGDAAKATQLLNGCCVLQLSEYELMRLSDKALDVLVGGI